MSRLVTGWLATGAVAVALTSAGPSFAETPPWLRSAAVASPPGPPSGGELQRGLGIGFTALGVAGFVATGVHLGTTDLDGDMGAYGLLVGAVPAGLGLLFSAIGVPLWIEGQSKIDRAREASGGASLSFVPIAGGAAVGVGGAL